VADRLVIDPRDQSRQPHGVDELAMTGHSGAGHRFHQRAADELGVGRPAFPDLDLVHGHPYCATGGGVGGRRPCTAK
jgi:hypothetical protein